MKKLTKPYFLVVTSIFAFTVISTAMAGTYNVTENTKVHELKDKMGAPVRSLIDDSKNADFLDIHKYTFLDAYKSNFGVVISGNQPSMYRLSTTLTSKEITPFFSIRTKEQSGDINVQDVTILGVKLGMNTQDAQQLLYQLPSFDGATATPDGNTEYQLSNGSHVILHADKNDNISEVELYLNAGTVN